MLAGARGLMGGPQELSGALALSRADDYYLNRGSKVIDKGYSISRNEQSIFASLGREEIERNLGLLAKIQAVCQLRKSIEHNYGLRVGCRSWRILKTFARHGERALSGRRVPGHVKKTAVLLVPKAL
jgi:hypothetical protein